MGACCSDEVKVDKDKLIPDPMRGQQNTFYCSKNAVFGKDYTAKASNSSDATPWLLINGEGGFFSDNAYYQVENFNREGKEDKNGNGEVLAFCKLDKFSSDNYDYDVKRAEYEFESHVDSDDSDYSSDSDYSDGEGVAEELEMKQKAKFKCKTDVKFSLVPGGPHVAKLKIKAKGKAKYKWKRQVIIGHDEEGNETRSNNDSVRHTEKLKKFFYKLEVEGVEYPLQMKGSLNKGNRHNSWHCPLFQGEVERTGWKGEGVEVKTMGVAPPGFELLLGFMTMVLLSPDDLIENLAVPWASHP